MSTKKEIQDQIRRLTEAKSQSFSENELQEIKIDLVDTLRDSLEKISKDMEQVVRDSVINWCAVRLVPITIAAFITISSLAYVFLSKHNEVQTLKIENQNSKIQCQNDVNSIKLITMEQKIDNMKKLKNN